MSCTGGYCLQCQAQAFTVHQCVDEAVACRHPILRDSENLDLHQLLMFPAVVRVDVLWQRWRRILGCCEESTWRKEVADRAPLKALDK